MHPALDIEEILDSIFQHLQRASLQAVARTCRRFFLPAIRILWRNTDYGYRRLTGLITNKTNSGVWRLTQTFERNRVEFLRSFVNIENPVTSQQFARFRIYADQIRYLNFRYATVDERPYSSLWDRISQLFLHVPESTPLLPHLQSLQGTFYVIQEMRALQLFLCPSLRSLDVMMSSNIFVPNAHGATLAFQSFLVDIGERSPGLLSLGLAFARFPADSLHVTCDTIVKLTQLRYLKCPPEVAFSDRGMNSLWLHSNLSQLTITNNPYAETPFSLRLANDQSLSVEQIHFERVLPGTAEAFLKVVPLPKLSHMELETTNNTSPGQLSGLINACATFVGLVSFTFKQPPNAFYVDFDAVLLDVFFPLVSCRKMEIFSVYWADSTRFKCPLHAGDDHFLVLAQAWTCLKEFVLCMPVPDELPGSLVDGVVITLQSLISFATYCPSLHFLHLPGFDPALSPVLAEVQTFDASFTLVLDAINGNRQTGLELLEDVFPRVSIEERCRGR